MHNGASWMIPAAVPASPVRCRGCGGFGCSDHDWLPADQVISSRMALLFILSEELHHGQVISNRPGLVVVHGYVLWDEGVSWLR